MVPFNGHWSSAQARLKAAALQSTMVVWIQSKIRQHSSHCWWFKRYCYGARLTTL